MLRIAFLSVLLCVSLSSASLSSLRKSISRRQSDSEHCQAIEDFDCKCTYYRVTCTSDRDLPSLIKVLPNEQKYQSVELVINGEGAQHVNENTFEPVKQLYKPEADNLEFRVKFEKFSELHLSSPGIFNRVFPNNLPSTVRKIMALEVYNPLVQPNDNPHLFSNLNVDSLELYVLYPFRGTFQQLFNGANIKFLRLSGGDIRSDLSQPFTGNIGRLELAKQASQLNTQNFPAYPAHELIINAFYVTDFTSENPPNYSNLGELRIYSQQRIPANAFQQYPNLHTLSISTEQDIDPHALDGLYNLEKLAIKDTKPSLELLNSLPNVKEFETNVEKLSETEQCGLVEKLATGKVAVQAIPNGYSCSCISAYLDTASGRYPCDAQNCEQSSCSSIRNNFDPTTHTFKTPPAIQRSDGSDALRAREPKVYTAPYQVSHRDQEKFQIVAPQHAAEHGSDSQQSAGRPDSSHGSRPSGHTEASVVDSQHVDDEDGNWQEEQQSGHTYPAGPSSQAGTINPERGSESGKHFDADENQKAGYGGDHRQHSDGGDHRQHGDGGEHRQHGDGDEHQQHGDGDEHRQHGSGDDHQQHGDGSEHQQHGDGSEHRQHGTSGGSEHDGDGSHKEGHTDETSKGGEDTGGQQAEQGVEENGSSKDSVQSIESDANDGSDVANTQSGKKRFNWIPIIIIIAAVVTLLLILLIIFILRKRKPGSEYNKAPTSEHGANPTNA